jgi:hypothetical protein
MSIYSVSFDLEKLGENCDGLINELKKCSDWCWPFATQCLVATSETAQQLTERLRRALGADNGLLVIGVSSNYSGWLGKDIWFWLNKHL